MPAFLFGESLATIWLRPGTFQMPFGTGIESKRVLNPGKNKVRDSLARIA
jgi:hypothetical protein